LDTQGATDQSPVRVRTCDASKATQLFTIAPQGSLFHIDLGAGGGCLENFFSGSITVWGNCPWQGGDSSGKAWSYDNATGALNNGGCLTASGEGGAVSVGHCDAAAANQQWDVKGAPMPTPPPPPPPRSDGHVIMLRGNSSLCMDSETASNTDPVKMLMYVARNCPFLVGNCQHLCVVSTVAVSNRMSFLRRHAPDSMLTMSVDVLPTKRRSCLR